MRVWLDDERIMPKEFDVHAKTAEEAINLLCTGKVTEISLDHDLGESCNGTGYDVAKWIEHAAVDGRMGKIAWDIHSQNPVGRRNMQAALNSAEKFWRKLDNP